jgi:predicted transcriptional regulator
MTTLTIELPADLYGRLQAEAGRLGKAADVVAQEWLAERLQTPTPSNDRDRSREVLRAAGLLAEPSDEMKELAAQSTLTLEEARAILDRAGGKPLSEVIVEMRGPKE